jgi:hypothetical protein
MRLVIGRLGERPTTRQPGPRSSARHRTKISLAVLSGIVAGAIRAVIDWILDHMVSQP